MIMIVFILFDLTDINYLSNKLSLANLSCLVLARITGSLCQVSSSHFLRHLSLDMNYKRFKYFEDMIIVGND